MFCRFFPFIFQHLVHRVLRGNTSEVWYKNSIAWGIFLNGGTKGPPVPTVFNNITASHKSLPQPWWKKSVTSNSILWDQIKERAYLAFLITAAGLTGQPFELNVSYKWSLNLFLYSSYHSFHPISLHNLLGGNLVITDIHSPAMLLL